MLIVPTFKYLGSIISNTCSMDDEIQNHFKQAWTSFGRLRRRVYLKTTTSIPLPKCLFTEQYVSPHCCMGVRHGPFTATISEAWKPSMRDASRRSSASFGRTVTHTEILEQRGSCSMDPTMNQHQLRWLGQVSLMSSHRLLHKVLHGQLHFSQHTAGGQKT